MNALTRVVDYGYTGYIFREYLCENELLSKTILAYLSGAQKASIHEIKKMPKIS